MGEMQDKSDAQLLRDYAERGLDAAFTEIVARYTDLVYSAALRQVESVDLAADVAQSVFVDLARKAGAVSGRLSPAASLAGWLHRGTRFAALNQLRDLRRRAANERQAMDQLLPNADDADWEQLRPALDEALDCLADEDREALFLRFFQNHDFRAVGQQLGVSAAAAQKRVTRAVDRLRGILARRGVAVGAGGLAALLSTNAVQAAPAGLAAAISSAATLAGATLTTTATATATKAIAMTTLQKALVTATVAVLTGAGIYEARQASRLRDRVQSLEQQQAPLAEQVRQLQTERDDASNRLVAANEELTRFNSSQKQAELLRLRGQVGSLRNQLATTVAEQKAAGSGFAQMMKDPAMKEYIRVAMQDMIKRRYGPLFQELKLTPEQIDQFTQMTTDLFSSGAQRMAARMQPGAGLAEPAQSGAEQDSEFGRQLVALLGEKGAARFKEFTQEIPARTTVDLLNVQLGGSKLSDDQGARLFQVVKTEPYELTRGIAGDPDQAFFGSQADIDAHLAKVAGSNQRILQQAGDFLGAEQLAALNTVLTNAVSSRIAQGAAFRPNR